MEAIHMVTWYAMEDQQVDTEGWRTQLDESLDHHTDPITATGKELVRGNAAEVIGHLNQPVAWRQRGPAEDQAFR